MVGVGGGHRLLAVWADGGADAVVGVCDGNRLGVGDDLTGGRNDRSGKWDAKGGVLKGGGARAGGCGGGGVDGDGGDGPGESRGGYGRGGDEAGQLAAGDSMLAGTVVAMLIGILLW
jgi:hypothetical protein